MLRYLALAAPLLVVWWLVYTNLGPASKLVTYSLFRLPPESHFSHAVEFFLYEAPKVFLLLTLVVFGVGIVRSFFTPERTRAILAGKRESLGNVLAALLGIVTPFCTCSAIPLFIGFVAAGVPLGVTFSFLISAPMVNEIGVGAGVHGYVPEGYLAGIMGKGAWWSVPAVVLIGIPMYSNAAGIIPVIHALLEKGAALGTALAFMMSVIGLSLP
jgi:uncharacterized protein